MFSSLTNKLKLSLFNFHKNILNTNTQNTKQQRITKFKTLSPRAKIKRALHPGQKAFLQLLRIISCKKGVYLDVI